MVQKVKIASLIMHSLWIVLKPLWLLSMFLFGLLLILLLPFGIFEYSISTSELDVMECAFVVYLVTFARSYISHCKNITAPWVRKVITPFVNLAHVSLLFVIGSTLVMLSLQESLELLLRVPINDLGPVVIDILIELIKQTTLVPVFDVMSFILSALALQYSFHKVSSFSRKDTAAQEASSNQSNFEGATK